jgi:hypothetical protein
LFGPWREWSKQALWSGRLPLWNPHIFAGTSFMGNGQASILYLPNIVYWLLPVPVAFVADAILHNVLLAFGGYVLARALGQSRTAAFLAATALALSGAVASHINVGHFTWHAARAYIPWELWALLLYLRTGQGRYALALGVLVALQVAAGYPPLVLLGAGMCVGLLLAYVVSHSLRRSPLSQNGHEYSPRGASVLPRGWTGAALGCGLLVVALSACFSCCRCRESSALSVHGSGLEFNTAASGSGTCARIFAACWCPTSSAAIGRSVEHAFSRAWEEGRIWWALVLVLAAGAPLWMRFALRVLERDGANNS